MPPQNHLITGQDPLPRLLKGWSLTHLYAWVDPHGKHTHEFICFDELLVYWNLGWLMRALDGRIVLSEAGRMEAQKGIHHVNQ